MFYRKVFSLTPLLYKKKQLPWSIWVFYVPYYIILNSQKVHNCILLYCSFNDNICVLGTIDNLLHLLLNENYNSNFVIEIEIIHRKSTMAYTNWYSFFLSFYFLLACYWCWNILLTIIKILHLDLKTYLKL